MNILILGASGLIGSSIYKEIQDYYCVYGTYCRHKPDFNKNILHFDVANSVDEILATTKPDIVISCLRGDYEQQLKRHEEIANYLKNTNGKLIYLSTGNVFDGDPSKVHSEEDEPKAFSEYGKFKIKCEALLKQIIPENLIVIRLPHIFSKETIKEEFKSEYESGAIEVITNLYISSNTNTNIVKTLIYIIKNNLSGIIHLTTTDIITQKDFIQSVIKNLDLKDPIYNEKTLTSKNYFEQLGYNFSYRDTKNLDNFYFALKTIRDDIPEELQITIQDVINISK